MNWKVDSNISSILAAFMFWPFFCLVHAVVRKCLKSLLVSQQTMKNKKDNNISLGNHILSYLYIICCLPNKINILHAQLLYQISMYPVA